MDLLIENLNIWGNRLAGISVGMFVQSSLLIVLLFLVDLVMRQRVRAVFRYGLWMLVLIKLLLPPSLALPTGLAYWLPQEKTVKTHTVAPSRFVVHYGTAKSDEIPVFPALPPPRPTLRLTGWLVLGWLTVAVGLMAWLARRSRQIATSTRQAIPAPDTPGQLLDICRRQMRIGRRIRLKLVTTVSSPAVYGLLRPVILIPQRLPDKLSALQLRAVLLHELAHIKRGDVLVHYAQTLLQIFYWWHPLLWLANAQIRRVREQAVDERVMVEMDGEAEAYPATLLEVAKLASRRPMPALGLIGIVESRSALAQRIRRLLESPVPKSAKLGFARLAAVALIGAVLLPMARGQRPAAQPALGVNARPIIVSIAVKFVQLTDPALEAVSLGSPTVTGPNGHRAWVLPPEDDLIARLQGQADTRILYAPSVTTHSGQQAQISDTQSQDFNGNVIEVGPICDLLPVVSGDWLDLTVSAKVTEFGEIVPDQLNGLQLRPRRSNGNEKLEESAVRSVNATGYIIHDAGTARVSVVNAGWVVLQNPEVKSITGKRILVVVSPRVIRETTSASTLDPNTDRDTPLGLIVKVKDAAKEAGIKSISVATGPQEANAPSVLESEPRERSGKPSRSEAAPSTSVPLLGNLPFLGPGRKAIQAKLNRIVLPEIGFDNVPLLEAIQWLAKESTDRDPDGTGLNILVNPNVIGAAQQTVIDPNTGQPVTLPPPEPLDMNGVRVRIIPPLKNVRLSDALEAIVKTSDKPIRYSIEEYAVVFSLNSTATAPLETRSFRFDPKTFFEDAQRFLLDAGLSDIEIFGHSNDWKGNIIRKFCESLGASHVPPNTIFYSDGSGWLMVRATHDELLRVQKAIERFNALRQKESASPSPAASAKVGKDTASQSNATEEVLVTQIAPFIYLGSQPVTLEMLKTKLAEGKGRNPKLNLVVKADHDAPVEQVAGVLETARSLNIEPFTTKPSERIKLETRVFRMAPQTFLENLRSTFKAETAEEKMDEAGSSIRDSLKNGAAQVKTFPAQQLVRDFFAGAGLNVQPPNVVFFNDRTGVLMVRASAREIDLAQKAIEVLNSAPAQITVEAKFLEMPTDAARKIGLDMPPPNATTNTWTRILTAAQSRAVLHAAEQRDGVDILSVPKITTLSGRQAQIQAVEIKTIMNGIAPEALERPGVRSKNSNPAQPFLTSQVNCGPTLDLVPHVNADGYTIHLTALPQVTEFLRYDTTLNGAKQTRVWVDGRQQQVALPRPVTRHRSMHAAVDIDDGQTLVLANPQVTVVSQQPTGESVTNAFAEDAGKRLLVFITPTIIDPAGNPIHLPGKEPFPTDKTPLLPR